MNFDTFRTMVQTFGSHAKKWEADDLSAADEWANSSEGSAVLNIEKSLDDRLDLICPPSIDDLTDRLFAAVMKQQLKQQFFVFWRYSAALSVLLMIGGFYFGWHQTQVDYVNAQSYFDTLFDLSY